MSESTLITGGCRSGKSRHALELAAEIEAKKKIFIATCIPHDDEMKQRVARHKAERSNVWTTVEEPVKLPEAIRKYSKKNNLILVDCLTLWVSNLFMEVEGEEPLEDHIQRLILAVETVRCPLIIVTNEVGSGIVPENRLAREFRDTIGLVNQRVAASVDRVIHTVAGIPVTIKDGKQG